MYPKSAPARWAGKGVFVWVVQRLQQIFDVYNKILELDDVTSVNGGPIIWLGKSLQISK
jgi:hypothetical protein